MVKTAVGHECPHVSSRVSWPMTLVLAGFAGMRLKTSTFTGLCVSRWRERLQNPTGRSAALLHVIGNVTDLVSGCLLIWWKWKFGTPGDTLYVCVWQRAFNAATVVNHLKKLQSSESEPSLSSASLTDVTVQSSSHRDRKTLGSSGDEAEDLDPNGNPFPNGSHLSCSIPGNVCQLLRVHPNKPGVLVSAEGWESWPSSTPAPVYHRGSAGG